MEEITERLDMVAQVISAHRFRFAHEDGLQEGLFVALTGAGLPFTREVLLSKRDRIDLLETTGEAPGIGIEVKVDGSTFGIAKQLSRYAEHARVGALLLVTSRMQHTALRQPLILGKPFRLVYVGGASF